MIEFSDRYSALGIPRPDPKTVCRGKCEGTGMVPLKLAYARGNSIEHREYRKRWREACAQPEAHDHGRERCDGWHFVKCVSCGGTGKR